METEITLLRLVSPLRYIAAGEGESFSPGAEDGETLCCFDLNEPEYLSFEPDVSKLLGESVFLGKAAGKPGGTEKKGGSFFELPRGNYLFAQQRKILRPEEIGALAVEIQQEGLWRRLKPGKKLYIRRLFEDGGWVTQLLRPCGPGQAAALN